MKQILLINRFNLFSIYLAFFFTFLAFSSDALDLGFDLGVTSYDQDNRPTLGVSLDIPFKLGNIPTYSVGYSFSFFNNHLYFSAPVIFGLYMSGQDTGDENNSLNWAILGVLIPENFKIHFPINSYVHLGLAIHPWGADYDFENNVGYYSTGIGAFINMTYKSKMQISPMVQYRRLIGVKKNIVYCGIKVGYHFGS